MKSFKLVKASLIVICLFCCCGMVLMDWPAVGLTILGFGGIVAIFYEDDDFNFDKH